MVRIGLSQVLDFLLLLGESAWISAWAIVLAAWSGNGTAPAFPVLLLLLATSFLLSRLASRGRHRAASALVVLAGLGVVILAASSSLGPPAGAEKGLAGLNRWLEGQNVGGAGLAAGLVALAWRQGVSLGRSRPDAANVEARFRTGAIAIATLLALVAVAGSAAHLSSDEIIPSTLMLLVAGLVGMPLARVADVSRQPRNRQGSALAPTGPWLTILIALVALILGATLVLARLFTFERISSMMDAVAGRLDSALTAAVYLLAIPFGLLVEGLIFLARLVLKAGPEQARPDQQGADYISRLLEAEPGSISPELLFALKAAVGLVLATVLAWVLWRAVSRLQRLWGGEDAEIVRDSVWSWPGWPAVWRWLLAQLRPVKERMAAASIRRGDRGQQEKSIRGLYRTLLRLGAAIGHARHLPETPVEYERRLARVAPDGETEVRAVSDAYSRDRYGPPSPSEPDLEPLAAALERLRAIWLERLSGRGRRQ